MRIWDGLGNFCGGSKFHSIPITPGLDLRPPAPTDFGGCKLSQSGGNGAYPCVSVTICLSPPRVSPSPSSRWEFCGIITPFTVVDQVGGLVNASLRQRLWHYGHFASSRTPCGTSTALSVCTNGGRICNNNLAADWPPVGTVHVGSYPD